MNKFLFFIVLAILSACSNEFLNRDEQLNNMTFRFKTESFGGQITKTTLSVDEDGITDIWVLQFDGSASTSVLRKAMYVSSVADINNLGVQLLTGDDQTVLFLTNSGDAELFSSSSVQIGVYTIADYGQERKRILEEDELFNGDDYRLMMYGSYNGDIPGGAVSVTLYRLCSKISFSYTSTESQDIFNPGIVKIRSVQLKGVAASQSFLHTQNTTTLTSPDYVVDYPKEFIGVGETSGSVVFYLPENIAGSDETITSSKERAEKAPQKVTYLEVTGDHYIGSDLIRTVVYIIYIGKTITDYYINGNTHYGVTVTFRGTDITDTRIYTEDNPWGVYSPVTINLGGDIGEVTWAPVNAGYDADHPYGLLYQFGRKYGQIYNGETGLYSTVDGTKTLLYGNDIANKDVFIKSSAEPYDWCDAVDRLTLWPLIDSYNPCPDGWRLPTIGEFKALILQDISWVEAGINGCPGLWFGPDAQGGRLNSVFFPAAGYRNYNASIQADRNNFGKYWSLDVGYVKDAIDYTLKAQDLSFERPTYDLDESSDLWTGFGSRGVARSVRCVKSRPKPKDWEKDKW